MAGLRENGCVVPGSEENHDDLLLFLLLLRFEPISRPVPTRFFVCETTIESNLTNRTTGKRLSRRRVTGLTVAFHRTPARWTRTEQVSRKVGLGDGGDDDDNSGQYVYPRGYVRADQKTPSYLTQIDVELQLYQKP